MATSIFREYFRGYEILGELGRGNARVLKARNQQTGEYVAIKHFAFNTEPDALRRFQRESEIMKSIQHDNIVKIIEVHLDAELPYIVMQLIEGGDLRSLLKTYGSLDMSTVIRLAHHMTAALDAIHTKAVVHRDIKPENIMYRRAETGELEFLLTDFGIAKLREQPDAITVTGSTMLTYDYASPEQFNQSKKVSAPTDYYSLGIVLYECLTGSVPFEYGQDDLLMHINRVVGTTVPTPYLHGQYPLPPAMLQLLEGLLAKQSMHRLADPAGVRRFLSIAAIEDLQGVTEQPQETPKQTLKHDSTIPAPAPVTAIQAKKREYTLSAFIILLVGVAIFFSWTTLVKSETTVPKAVPSRKIPVTTKTVVPKVMQARHTMPAQIIQNTAITQPEENTDAQITDILPQPETPGALATEVLPKAVMKPETLSGISLNNGIYFNDFSDRENSSWDTGKDENSEFYYVEGKYVMRGLTDSLSYSSSERFNLDIQKNFAISANMTHRGDSASDPFGINFCGDVELDAYLVFYITSNGYYSIGASIKNEWEVLIDWTESSEIRKDNQMNVLGIEKHGETLRFLINDKVVKTLPYAGGFGNYFGMRVDGAQTVMFDQFIVKGSQ